MQERESMAPASRSTSASAFADGLVVLGGLKAETVPIKAAILALGTIFTCYLTSSVLLGHTPLWLPDITHCARGSPERYFFRIGMCTSCCMLVLVWVTTGVWADRVCKEHGTRGSCCKALPNDKSALTGAIGCLLLIMGSCCIEPGDMMPWTFHTIGATGFFLCQVFAMCSVTSNVSSAARAAEESGLVVHGVSPMGLVIKKWCVKAFYALLALEAILPICGVKGPTGAVLEWLLTANVMVWVVSLSYDFSAAQLYAAYVEPQQGLPSTKTSNSPK